MAGKGGFGAGGKPGSVCHVLITNRQSIDEIADMVDGENLITNRQSIDEIADMSTERILLQIIRACLRSPTWSTEIICKESIPASLCEGHRKGHRTIRGLNGRLCPAC